MLNVYDSEVILCAMHPVEALWWVSYLYNELIAPCRVHRNGLGSQ